MLQRCGEKNSFMQQATAPAVANSRGAMTTTSSSFAYVNAEGNRYLMKDVSTAGDCALLSLLYHLNFQAPLTTSEELSCADVSFATSVQWDNCFNVYAMVGD
jgi:hypothetical protein